MKTKVLIVILIISFIIINRDFLHSQETVGYEWVKVENIPDSTKEVFWLDVFALPSNPNYLWIGGFNGNLLISTNAGENWTMSKSEEMIIDTTYDLGQTIYDTTYFQIDQLESICFVNELIGYVSGYDLILKSTDGGKSWKNITPEYFVNNDYGIWGNYFLNENWGILIGGGCDYEQRFHLTTNGGRTWAKTYYHMGDTGLSDLILFPDGSGYASSSGMIWNTLDSGRTWNVFSVSGKNDWQEDIAIKGNTILVPYSGGCSGGAIFNGGLRISTDLGKNWKELQLEIGMYGTFLLDEKRGWGVGNKLRIYYTNDGGENWIPSNNGIKDSIDFDDIWFINDTTGWLVGDGIYKFTGKIEVITDVKEHNNYEMIKISPNPVTDILKLNLTLDKRTSITIRFLNTTGIVVFKNNYGIYESGEDSLEIDVQNISTGVYFLEIRTDTTIELKKIIKL
jgi:photosystem II stability/assembly factor-like uncharacterized protein